MEDEVIETKPGSQKADVSTIAIDVLEAAVTIIIKGCPQMLAMITAQRGANNGSGPSLGVSGADFLVPEDLWGRPMIRFLACLIFALLLPLVAFADAPPLPVLAECEGVEADASHVAIHFVGKANDLISELVRFRQLEVAHIDRVGSAPITFELPCVSVNFLLGQLAELSGLQVVHVGDTRFRMVKVSHLSAIIKLRKEASAARGTDRKQLIAVLKRLVALSQPGGPDEPPASVEDELHELGNLAMQDKDYLAAEGWYRARLADLDRSGAAQDTNYGIAVSNVADALAYQDETLRAKPIYERALAVLEKQVDLAAPSNAVLILETLSNDALANKRFDEAESLADRAWKLLGDPRRSQWEHVEDALEFAATAEGELGTLGLKVKAYAHYERALQLLESRYPAESAELVTIRHQVMHEAGRNGKLERATAVAEQQLAAARQRGESTTDAYLIPVYQLLALYAEKNALERVIALWPSLIDARRALLGDNSPNVVAALRQLATLYRLNGQWSLADATDRRATAIKPVDDSKALDRIELLSRWAMDNDPALPLICAKYAWTPTGLGYEYIPPIAPIPPLGLIFIPSPMPRPVPAEKSAQARYLEQTAECFSDSPDYAGRAMEKVLLLRIDLNGADSPEAHQASQRAIHFFQQDGNAKAIQRVRAISVE